MKKKTISIIFVFGALVLTGLLLSSCGGGSILPTRSEPTLVPTVIAAGGVTAEGRLVPAASSVLAFSAGGEISEIPVAEGDAVAQGAVLMRLGKHEALDAALSTARLEEMAAQDALDTLQEKANLAGAQAAQTLAQTRLTVLDAQEALDNLDTQDFRDDLDDRSIAVEDAREALDDAQTERNKFDGVDEDNTGRRNAQDELDDAQQVYDDAVYDRDLLQNQLDQSEAAVQLAQSALEDAQRENDARKTGPDPDELALAQARLENAQAQIAAAERALSNMVLTAPYAATVIDLADLDPGEYLTPGKPAVTIADTSAWFIETRDLTELEVVDVQAGQSVTIVPDALRDLELTGEVISIDQAFFERSGDILYTVRIRLNESDPRLRWGMTVTVTFEE